MWRMGYNDGAELNISDSFNGRKLRPLIPRPLPFSSPSFHPPCLSLLHGTEFLSLNQHLAAEQNKKEFNAQPVIVSSRWNPTPEQLRTLEDLYRRGTRTPSAEQIQQITAQLRRYGKIEGKNVFYWFQNHKARERQKRRREMESASGEQHRQIECLETKDLGASRTGLKEGGCNTNCSTFLEESVSMQRASKATAGVTEGRTDGWVPFEERELQQRRNFMQRNATWPMVQLSGHPYPTHLIKPSVEITHTAVTADPKPIKTHAHLNLFKEPYGSSEDSNEEDGSGESQTLQLFPLRGDRNRDVFQKGNDDEVIDNIAMNATDHFTHGHQFYEFLPIKN